LCFLPFSRFLSSSRVSHFSNETVKQMKKRENPHNFLVETDRIRNVSRKWESLKKSYSFSYRHVIQLTSFSPWSEKEHSIGYFHRNVMPFVSIKL
jgi:hypothetical protein